MRARKSEEPKDSRDTAGDNLAGDTDVRDEERFDSVALERSLDRMGVGEDLRDCLACGESTTKSGWYAHLIKAHPTRHGDSFVPKGYYGCKTGAEFWLPLRATKGPCKWICSICKEPRFYWGEDNKHGGPWQRLIDRRYGLDICLHGRYPNHKRYLGKIDGARGPSVFYHEGAPNPEQPVQDDPALTPFIKETKSEGKVPKKANTKTGRSRSSKPTGRARRAD